MNSTLRFNSSRLNPVNGQSELFTTFEQQTNPTCLHWSVIICMQPCGDNQLRNVENNSLWLSALDCMKLSTTKQANNKTPHIFLALNNWAVCDYSVCAAELSSAAILLTIDLCVYGMESTPSLSSIKGIYKAFRWKISLWHWLHTNLIMHSSTNTQYYVTDYIHSTVLIVIQTLEALMQILQE